MAMKRWMPANRSFRYDREEYERFQNLGEEIRIQLQDAVRGGANPEDECGRRIVALHKEWLGKTWKQYTKEAHAAIGNLYISDEEV